MNHSVALIAGCLIGALLANVALWLFGEQIMSAMDRAHDWVQSKIRREP